VREPPHDVADAEVLAEVRRVWDADVDRVAYLPVGFGAYHWAAYAGSEARLFVTYDRLEPKRDAARLEAAYAGAAALCEAGLEFVLAGREAHEGGFTVPLAAGALSSTPWREGSPDGPLDLAWTTAALGRLHSTEPPPDLPLWRPLVGVDFAETLATLTHEDWGPGPFADRARAAVSAHLADLDRWTQCYHHLAEAAHSRAWVATHGEPDSGNQLLTSEGRLLVDWESLKLAPAELDLRTLVSAGVAPHEASADPEMVELFDLEWRLDEVSQYADWFAAPHPGTADDEIAFGGLLEELGRE
jgi:spectinomycin phosphotransferase